MPFYSANGQGGDLLRQFFTQLTPAFSPGKQDELRRGIRMVNRAPGMSMQEGISFQTNKPNPFIPDFNGSGFAPFMFAGGTLPSGGIGGGIGDPDGNGGQGDPGDDGPSGPPSGGGDPDPPPDPPPEGSDSSDSSSSSSSDSSSVIEESACGADPSGGSDSQIT